MSFGVIFDGAVNCCVLGLIKNLPSAFFLMLGRKSFGLTGEAGKKISLIVWRGRENFFSNCVILITC